MSSEALFLFRASLKMLTGFTCMGRESNRNEIASSGEVFSILHQSFYRHPLAPDGSDVHHLGQTLHVVIQ